MLSDMGMLAARADPGWQDRAEAWFARRSEADGPTTCESVNIMPCAVCGEPATGYGYDGLDPNERRDTHTGRPYSTDMAHYQPRCAAHASAGQPLTRS